MERAKAIPPADLSDAADKAQGAFPEGDSWASVRLRLYVAPPAPTSVRAVANLDAILLGLGDASRVVSVETIDVLGDPRRALKDRITVTPTLALDQDGAPPPLIGDLSNTAVVRAFILTALRRDMPG